MLGVAPLVAQIPLVFAAGLLVGYAISSTVSILRLQGARSLVFTLGLAVSIESVYLEVFGPESKIVPPVIESTFRMGIIEVETYKLVSAVVSWLIIASLHLTFYKTSRGLRLVASMDSRELALSLGVNVDKMRTVIAMISGSIVCLAGFITAPIIQPYYLNGLTILVLSLIVVVAGGLGNIAGGLIASIALYSTEGLLA
jgi:branched-chain amino acid transport system permease protein